MFKKILVFSLVAFFFAGRFSVSAAEYQLPYPGILPDSPVWVVKDWRDRMVSWFIFDKEKKARYYLFLADKRLAAGKMLSDYGKSELGKQTYESANWFLKKSATDADAVMAKELLSQISLAANKNYEVTGNSEALNWVRKLFEKRLSNLLTPTPAQK